MYRVVFDAGADDNVEVEFNEEKEAKLFLTELYNATNISGVKLWCFPDNEDEDAYIVEN